MSTSDELLLAHHGVKGQKWGVRNPRDKKSTTSAPAAHTLSDEHLKEAIARMNLEKQYKSLIGNKEHKAGAEFAKGLGKTLATVAATAVTTKAVAQAFKAAGI